MRADAYLALEELRRRRDAERMALGLAAAQQMQSGIQAIPDTMMRLEELQARRQAQANEEKRASALLELQRQSSARAEAENARQEQEAQRRSFEFDVAKAKGLFPGSGIDPENTYSDRFGVDPTLVGPPNRNVAGIVNETGIKAYEIARGDALAALRAKREKDAAELADRVSREKIAGIRAADDDGGADDSFRVLRAKVQEAGKLMDDTDRRLKEALAARDRNNATVVGSRFGESDDEATETARKYRKEYAAKVTELQGEYNAAKARYVVLLEELQAYRAAVSAARAEGRQPPPMSQVIRSIASGEDEMPEGE